MNVRAFIEMVHLPSRRKGIEVLGAGFAVALICWYFGANAWHSILLGCAITVIALALQLGSSAPDALDLSWRPGRRTSREGSRRDVASLSASLRGGWGFVGLTSERRLQEIAHRRLALEGLDLRDPGHRQAIEQLIGAPAYRALHGRQGRMPTLRALTHCLDALDALDSTHYPVPSAGGRRRDRFAIPFSLGRRP